MHKHIDFYNVEKPDKDEYMQEVDVKSRKRLRKDKNFNDDWIWLEHQNVQGKLDAWRSFSYSV